MLSSLLLVKLWSEQSPANRSRTYKKNFLFIQAFDDDTLPPCLGVTSKNLIDAGLAKSTAEGRLKVVFSQFGDVSRGAYILPWNFYVHFYLCIFLGKYHTRQHFWWIVITYSC